MYRAEDSLQPWKAGAKKLLLTRPLLVDETGFRVDKKNWWLHAATDGSLTLKYLHRKRGKEAIDAFGTIPFYFGVLIHAGDHTFYTDASIRYAGRISFATLPLSLSNKTLPA